ncbi:MAG: response regulator [Anaerolineales bacterium]|nr:response regulator [Anaerolineales bacterium]
MSQHVRQIWIVDDEPLITRALQRLIGRLLRRGTAVGAFELQADNSPRRAIETMRQNGHDVSLVIADIMMPELNGLDFLHEVKAMHPLAPRIILTGYADKENAIRALNELDLFAYIEKPWDDEQFRTLVGKGLQQYRQNRMEVMFRRYVPTEVIEAYIDQSDATILAGQPGEATILFLDFVEFTRLSEKMAAVDVVRLLNAYLAEMVDIVQAHGGILDKFTGDGLMAVFGMPRTAGDAAADAWHGVQAALEIVACVAEMNARRPGEPQLRVRIGLNTGPVVAGNIGSPRRVNYTVVSDAVNTASRIEDAARHLIGDAIGCVVVSESTYRLVQPRANGLRAEAVGPVALRGKETAVGLYRIF